MRMLIMTQLWLQPLSRCSRLWLWLQQWLKSWSQLRLWLQISEQLLIAIIITTQKRGEQLQYRPGVSPLRLRLQPLWRESITFTGIMRKLITITITMGTLNSDYDYDYDYAIAEKIVIAITITDYECNRTDPWLLLAKPIVSYTYKMPVAVSTVRYDWYLLCTVAMTTAKAQAPHFSSIGRGRQIPNKML